jgi:dTDP-glucose 4,6-dehydratase
MQIVIARGFAFDGEYLSANAHFAIKNFEKQASETGKIIIKSDGSAKRSYMKGEDLAKVLLYLLSANSNLHYIYNIGSDEARTLKEWAYIIAEKSGAAEVEILNKLKPLHCDSSYTEVSGAKTAFIMIKPELVVEIKCIDLLDENTSGAIRKMRLSFDKKSGYEKHT